MYTKLILLVTKLQEEQAKHGGAVKIMISGQPITSIDYVPAEGGSPAYVDIVGQ